MELLRGTRPQMSVQSSVRVATMPLPTPPPASPKRENTTDGWHTHFQMQPKHLCPCKTSAVFLGFFNLRSGSPAVALPSRTLGIIMSTKIKSQQNTVHAQRQNQDFLGPTD